MSSTILANHTLTKDRRLDCISHFDPKSRAFLSRDLLEADPITTKVWPLSICLDQGNEGACVGFGFSHELAAEPAPVPGVTNEKAIALYKRAQDLDEWPGNKYEGTSVLAGAKACQEGGFLDAYFWATSALEVAQAISHIGPVVIGVDWLTGMEEPDAVGFIHAVGSKRGGHCVCLHGVFNKEGTIWFRGQNSWGTAWGDKGGFFIALSDLQVLVDSQGAFCVPTSREIVGKWPEHRRRRWFEFLPFGGRN